MFYRHHPWENTSWRASSFTVNCSGAIMSRHITEVLEDRLSYTEEGISNNNTSDLWITSLGMNIFCVTADFGVLVYSLLRTNECEYTHTHARNHTGTTSLRPILISINDKYSNWISRPTSESSVFRFLGVRVAPNNSRSLRFWITDNLHLITTQLEWSSHKRLPSW